MLAALPGAPVIVYNIPQFTGVEFSKQNAARLLGNPGVVGVKHTSSNLYSLERMKEAYPDKIFLNGFDEQFLAALTMGAIATIGTTVNLFAPLFHKVRDAVAAGELERAQRWQREINLRVEETVRIGIFPAMKYGWTLRGVDCGNCRAPFRPLGPEARQAMEALLERPLE